METYQLIVNIAIFLGVMSLVLLTEGRRRAEMEQAEKLEQTLQALKASLEDQLNQVRTGIQSAAKEIGTEVGKSTAATEALKASLEEPIKFPAQTKQ